MLSAVQEIYPPRLSDFSYVTDNTCEDKEILKQEVVSLKVCIYMYVLFAISTMSSVH